MNIPGTQGNDRAKSNDPGDGENSTFGQDVLTSLAFLSRLPIRLSTSHYSLAGASRAFGGAGLILGAIVGAVFWIASAAGLDPVIAVIVALAAGALVTGGLHEDGLADVADGFGGGWSVERKLAIMRDSQIGAYGVLALIFSVGFRIAAYAAIFATGPSGLELSLIASIGLFGGIGCLSRAPLALMMYQLPLARKDGRAAEAGSPTHDNMRYGLFVSAALGFICLMFALKTVAVIAVFTFVAMAYLLMARLAKSQIGGYSGDVLGALQQTGEIFGLLAVLMFQ